MQNHPLNNNPESRTTSKKRRKFKKASQLPNCKNKSKIEISGKLQAWSGRIRPWKLGHKMIIAFL